MSLKFNKISFIIYFTFREFERIFYVVSGKSVSFSKLRIYGILLHNLQTQFNDFYSFVDLWVGHTSGQDGKFLEERNDGKKYYE